MERKLKQQLRKNDGSHEPLPCSSDRQDESRGTERLIEKFPSHEPTFLTNIVNKGFDAYEHKDELKEISMSGWLMLYKQSL